MSIWNKVLIGLIVVVSLVFFYMASRALQVHTYWSSLAKQYEQKLQGKDGLLAANRKLAEGDADAKMDGIRQLKLKLHHLLVDRRRMWTGCIPQIKLAGGKTEIVLTLAQPGHGIVKSTVLYAFESHDVNPKAQQGGADVESNTGIDELCAAKRKGQYVGEFAVTVAGDKQLTLTPTAKLMPNEIAKLNALSRSSNKWTLYELMPRDNHDIFDLATDAQKKTLFAGLSADCVREYLRDGKPAEKDDPQDCLVGGKEKKYVRPLHDYLMMFNAAREADELLTASIRALQANQQLAAQALVLAREQEDACKKANVLADEEKKVVVHERDAVKAVGDKLETHLVAMQSLIAQFTKTNQAMAGQIAKFQLEAAERINQRTRAMVQSGVGVNRVGIYDRDYYRQSGQSERSFPLPRTAVGWLIAINAAVWLADLFFGKPTAVDQHGAVAARSLSDLLALKVASLTQPWLWWQFLTAGFTHSPKDIWHILGNMFVLFMFGRPVEDRYGTKEFLRVYLVALVFANIVWCVATKLAGGENAAILGASGAIAGVVVLFAFNYPHNTILLFFVVPMPAWLFGVLIVFFDILGAMQGKAGNVAYLAHVAGAAFAAIYYLQNWNFSALSLHGLGRPFTLLRRKPRLRVHDPDSDSKSTPSSSSDLKQQVDRILEKIYREGEASLTPDERHTLEVASREYQHRSGR